MTDVIRRDEIEDVLAHIFNSMDWARHEAIGEAFALDAVFTLCFSRQDRENGNLITVTGGDEIVGFFRKSFATIEQTHHTVSNLTSKSMSAGATASVHIRAYHKGKGAVADLFEESLAIADLVLRRDGDGVRIARFDYTVLIVLGSTAVFAEAGYD